MNIHYFDHATTSRPKVAGVAEASLAFYRDVCVSPSRSGHRLGSMANDVLSRAREIICEYFQARSSSHIVFTSGATEAVNLVIRSLLQPGDEVVTSSLDHNAVIRPIARLKEAGVIVKLVKAGLNLPDFVQNFIGSFNDRTRLAIVTQASNIDGTVVPVHEIRKRASEMGIPVLVDGAQSVGWLDRQQLVCGADYFVASLHKGLRGPFGLGVLVVGDDDAELQPLYDGGTGFESENALPQSVIPNGLEVGTLNIAAIAGAIPAFEQALSQGNEEARRNTADLFRLVLDNISSFNHMRVFTPLNKEPMVPIVSLKHDRLDVGSFARILDTEYGILSRAGLHCAPLRHGDLGTLPDGTVRISFGFSTTEEDVRALIHALQDLDREEQ